ncbi:MAG: LuxR family transcriptional regulator [Bacteroidetes bacterium]|nr:MAG: LuxR family transcriptional regulator [Bacteroidota bacterium]
MNDPRLKRPSIEDLKDKRHAQWLKTLKGDANGNGAVVIQMKVPKFGKTAQVLSERELEILQLISFGCSSRDIADKLCLSTHTITNHRKNMLARSRCGNFAELVRVAIQEDLL